MLLENLLCARPAVGDSASVVLIRPHSLHALPSVSFPALLALLSTGQACPTSRPIYARTISLSGLFLPRSVHDSFLSTSMCSPNATSLLKPRPGPTPHSSKVMLLPHLPPAPPFPLRRTQSHLPPVFYFSMFYIVLGFQLEFRGLVLLSHSCAPGACGNTQRTAAVQCIQWVGVWSQVVCRFDVLGLSCSGNCGPSICR